MHAARGIPLGVQPYPKKLRPQKSETETKTDSCHLWKGPGTLLGDIHRRIVCV